MTMRALRFSAWRCASCVRRRRALLPILEGHRVWMVNSTSRGGGEAELLPPLLALLRELGVDANWLVMEADDALARTRGSRAPTLRIPLHLLCGSELARTADRAGRQEPSLGVLVLCRGGGRHCGVSARMGTSCKVTATTSQGGVTC
ncbi:hypothetical protein [Bosea thiooxidans]